MTYRLQLVSTPERLMVDVVGERGATTLTCVGGVERTVEGETNQTLEGVAIVGRDGAAIPVVRVTASN